LVLFAASGAHCQGRYAPYFGARAPQAPQLLREGATLDEVIDVVNGNTARVQSFSTADARITGPGMPGLRATIAIERPWRFRLKASTPLTGPEVDLGSNEELFWVWVRRNAPPTLLYCRHDDFASSAPRREMPVEPRWLIDALGLVSFDPTAEHRGPFPNRDGNIEIHSTPRSAALGMEPAGPLTKITVIDRTRGWVLQQHVYSAGDLVASATASNHRYDPALGVSLPGHVLIEIPRAQLSMNIDLGNFQINRQMGDPAQIWAKPVYAGSAEVDLCWSNPPPTSFPPSSFPPASFSAPSFRPSIPRESRLRSLPPAGGGRRAGAWSNRF